MIELRSNNDSICIKWLYYTNKDLYNDLLIKIDKDEILEQIKNELEKYKNKIDYIKEMNVIHNLLEDSYYYSDEEDENNDIDKLQNIKNKFINLIEKCNKLSMINKIFRDTINLEEEKNNLYYNYNNFISLKDFIIKNYEKEIKLSY